MGDVSTIQYVFEDSLVERRRALRGKFFTRVSCCIRKEKKILQEKMDISDISQDGALLLGDAAVSVCDEIDITLKAPFSDFREITLSGNIVRIQTDKNRDMRYIGVRFNENIYQDKIDLFVRDINKGYYNV